MACTTILVGRKASYDGSTLIARNEDSANGEFDPKRFVIVRPDDQPRTYRSVMSHVSIDLPDNPFQYSSVPNADLKIGLWAEAGVNEANVAMSATETITSNERVLGADPLVEYRTAQGEEGSANYIPEQPGGIGEEDFVTLVLPYIRSAREGVLRLGELLAQYGTYEMNGVAFSDVNEIWWLETIGGHHWIAKRVPDDAYVAMPNQLGIDEFDLEDAFGDQLEHMCSDDLIEFINRHHLNLSFGTRLVINPRELFGSHSDADHVYNTPRAWAIQRYFNSREDVWDGPDADFTPESDDLAWARQPEHKITIEDVKYALSLHYQGTPYDPYGTRGDEHSRHRYRPIGINRQSHLALMQIRPYAPQCSRSIQWLAYGSNPFNTLVPMYANVNTAPAYLADTTTKVSTEHFYWQNRLIAALCDANFAATANAIERYQLDTGAMSQRMIIATDESVLKALAESGVVQDGVDVSCCGAECCDAVALIDTASREEEIRDAEAIITAVRNDQVRSLLHQANEQVASSLRQATDSLLADVLYTASMAMSNGFNRSDH